MACATRFELYFDTDSKAAELSLVTCDFTLDDVGWWVGVAKSLNCYIMYTLGASFVTEIPVECKGSILAGGDEYILWALIGGLARLVTECSASDEASKYYIISAPANLCGSVEKSIVWSNDSHV